MPKRNHPRKLLVEGDTDPGVVAGLMEANAVRWPDPPDDVPVFIDSRGSVDEILKPGVLEAELGASGLEALGVVVDANGDASTRWDELRKRCNSEFSDLPDQIPAEGLKVLHSRGPRFGIWKIPWNTKPSRRWTERATQNDTLTPLVQPGKQRLQFYPTQLTQRSTTCIPTVDACRPEIAEAAERELAATGAASTGTVSQRGDPGPGPCGRVAESPAEFLRGLGSLGPAAAGLRAEPVPAHTPGQPGARPPALQSASAGDPLPRMGAVRLRPVRSAAERALRRAMLEQHHPRERPGPRLLAELVAGIEDLRHAGRAELRGGPDAPRAAPF